MKLKTAIAALLLASLAAGPTLSVADNDLRLSTINSRITSIMKGDNNKRSREDLRRFIDQRNAIAGYDTTTEEERLFMYPPRPGVQFAKDDPTTEVGSRHFNPKDGQWYEKEDVGWRSNDGSRCNMPHLILCE